MTHFFSVNENEMSQLVNGTKTFDILKFNRTVSKGDTIIYQLEEKEAVEGEEETDDSPQLQLPEEHSVKIAYLFDDSEGALKKGFVGVGFANNQNE